MHVRLHFCSIIEMRAELPPLPDPARLDDIADARAGARAIFFVDDNITLACRGSKHSAGRSSTAASRRRLHRSGMTAPIAAHGYTLVPLKKPLPLRVPRNREHLETI